MTDHAIEFHSLYRDVRIQDQRQYYEARRTEYRTAYEQLIMTRNALLVASALVGVAGQVTNGAPRAVLAVAAGVMAALAGAVTAFGAVIGFPQLSKLYSDVAINLAEAEIDWDALEPHADLASELDRVEEIFRKENGQWGQLVVEADSTRREPGGTARENNP